MLNVQVILTDNFNQYEQGHKITPEQLKAAIRIINCRTEAMGGHVEVCPKGHYQRTIYNSCKHRTCAMCSGTKTNEWIEKRKAQLLDTKHYHVIFTIPHELNELWMINTKVMADKLFESAWEALSGMMQNEDFLGGTPGVIATLQTWGETMSLHPHVHMLVTGGGVDKSGEWRSSKENYLVPVKTLMQLFRAKYIRKLQKETSQGKIKPPKGMMYKEVQALLKEIKQKDWNVYIGKEYNYGDGVAIYLGRYIKGGPISNKRLKSYDGKTVEFYYDDNHEEEVTKKRKTMELSAEEFIRRLLMHVPPDGFKTVRSYGIYAGSKRETLNKCRERFGQKKYEEEIEDIKGASWLDELVEEGRVCPICGERLEVKETIPFGGKNRAAPEVLETEGLEEKWV